MTFATSASSLPCHKQATEGATDGASVAGGGRRARDWGLCLPSKERAGDTLIHGPTFGGFPRWGGRKRERHAAVPALPVVDAA